LVAQRQDCWDNASQPMALAPSRDKVKATATPSDVPVENLLDLVRAGFLYCNPSSSLLEILDYF